MSVNNLLKPRSIEVETAEGNPYSATVTMEPFETGYAHTLGNALRRVLLSSMIGYAPTEAQIAGVVHEYSQIDGVKEDVVDILLNVKGVIFKLENRDEVTVTLRKEGTGPVTAADFDLPHDCQILNPDHVIANLSGGKLDMQIKVEKGRGYQPGDMRALKDDYSKATIGKIIMDASFSPVLRVAYKVENARVEQRTDLDKLVLSVDTNGAILPEEAVRQAAHILQDQLSVFGGIATIGIEPVVPVQAQPVIPQQQEIPVVKPQPPVDPILRRPVDDLELTVRSANCLRQKIFTTSATLFREPKMNFLRHLT